MSRRPQESREHPGRPVDVELPVVEPEGRPGGITTCVEHGRLDDHDHRERRPRGVHDAPHAGHAVPFPGPFEVTPPVGAVEREVDPGCPSTPPIPIRMEHQFPSVSASMHWDSASYCALTSARWPGGMVTALTAPGTLTNVVELVMKNAVSVPTRPR